MQSDDSSAYLSMVFSKIDNALCSQLVALTSERKVENSFNPNVWESYS